MKQKPIDHDPVFNDPVFAERYAKEQRKVFRWMHPPIVKGLKANGFKGGRILDDGCGPGYHTVGMKVAFPESEVVGIDLSEPLLDMAQKHLSESRIVEGVNFQSADVLNLPFEDNSFDAVINTFMFHLVDDPVKMCNEIERVLIPDGQLVMIDLRRNWLLSFFEREMRMAHSLPEALEIIKTTRLRPVKPKKTPIWWGVMG